MPALPFLTATAVGAILLMVGILVLVAVLAGFAATQAHGERDRDVRIAASHGRRI